jgi:lipoprotein-anchoring transpeptidase ErfK/SrfK
VVDRKASVPIRRSPGSRTLAVAGWKTPFGSVRRLRVVDRRGDWFAVESDVLGNGVVGWVPRTAAVRLQAVRYSVEADLSERLLTLREDGRIVFRRRVSIGAPGSPTPSGRFHVTDQISGRKWGLGCCIVVFSGTQPRLPVGWNGGDRLAVHGRPSSAGRIGAPTSAGCLHATEQTLRALSRLPLGTPVVVHP